MFRNQSGQISLGAITIAASLVVAMVGGWIAQNNITNGKIEDLRIEQQVKIDKLNDKISKIDTNVALICQKLNVKCRE